MEQHNLQQIEREAYGAACATADPYWAGVEALARLLQGKDTDPRLQQWVRDLGRPDR